MRQVIDFRRDGLGVAGEFVSVRFETNFWGLVSCFLEVAGNFREGTPRGGVERGDRRAKTGGRRAAKRVFGFAGKAGMESGQVMLVEGWRGAQCTVRGQRGKWLRGREKFWTKMWDGGRGGSLCWQ